MYHSCGVYGGIIFPTFVGKSCCNPCCQTGGSVGGVSTNCCHGGSVGGTNTNSCGCGCQCSSNCCR